MHFNPLNFSVQNQIPDQIRQCEFVPAYRLAGGMTG